LPILGGYDRAMDVSPPSWLVRVLPLDASWPAPADQTLLDSARAAGVLLPSSCRNGTCRACRCQLLEGQVRYTIEWPGLSAEERAEGDVLPCVALPCSPVVLQVDDARPIDAGV
jgi:ferredoxin